ncbi:MAG: X-Pro aminopeptidase, partial [Hyphomicrobiales bacterium]
MVFNLLTKRIKKVPKLYQSYDHSSDPNCVKPRITSLRRELASRELDGFIVPRSDEHMNEYVPPGAERLNWISGFSGSAGLAIILKDRAALFVDGRYTLQAAQQTDTEAFSIHHLIEEPASDWIEANLAKGARLGFDPMLHSISARERLDKACAKAGAELVACPDNPLDRVWSDRPEPPLGRISIHGPEHAGRAAADKLAELAQSLKEAGAVATILTLTDSIAWAFNIRGHDLPHTPVVLAFAIIHADARPALYVRPEKLSPDVKTYLGELAEIYEPGQLQAHLGKLGADGCTVRLDPARCPYGIAQSLTEAGAKIQHGEDPCIAPKAQKNETEIEGARAAHLIDGAALTRFLAWLDRTAPGGGVTEISAAEHLEACRRDTGKLRDISFDTISGAGPNGAIVHYRVNRISDRALGDGELYLVDSGGQYEFGTTDVTRTVAIGAPPPEAVRHFTLVLKGHIALARARFPKGTTGLQLDCLARNALWQAGLDFDHGTGHGVGSFLSVHEGPQSISKAGKAALVPGMILSNEPGFYREGAYGIRIENLMLVHEPGAIEGGERPMLGFETLTLAPIAL